MNTKILILKFEVFSLKAQETDKATILNIYKNALSSYDSYQNLKLICDSTKGRMVGSKESLKALEILQKQLKEAGADTVFLQNYKSSAWINKSKSKVIVTLNNNKKVNLNVEALGGSVSTPKGGIESEIVEVFSLAEVDSLGEENISGKIVF